MKLSIMDPIEQKKEVYARPEAESIFIVTEESIVQNISNPGGDVPPIEEE